MCLLKTKNKKHKFLLEIDKTFFHVKIHVVVEEDNDFDDDAALKAIKGGRPGISKLRNSHKFFISYFFRIFSSFPERCV